MEYNSIMCSNQNIDIKIEIKEEALWEEAPTTELKHQPEVKFEFANVLQITKTETATEFIGVVENFASLESPRLNSNTVYQDGSSSALPVHKMTPDGEQVCKSEFYEKTNTEILPDRFISDEVVTRPYKCDSCEKSFNQKSDLKRHIFGHSGLKPYKCYNCEKSFNRSSDLKRHTLCHSTTKPYKCDNCEKSFTIKSGLIRHTLRHLGTKPYKCDVCDKSFNDQSNLIRHTLCHTGIKPYKCDICEKSFNDRSCLRKHALIHSGLKPYKCDNCGKCFNRKSHLTRHAICHSNAKPVTMMRRVSTVSQT